MEMRNWECGIMNAELGVQGLECGMLDWECGVQNAELGIKTEICDYPMPQATWGSLINMNVYERK